MTPITQFTSDARCNQCQGQCWNPKDNSATQKAARKMFGITPNNCLPDFNGKTRCPYSKVQN